MALAHTISNKAKAAYARSNLVKKRADLMESWAGYLGGSGRLLIPSRAAEPRAKTLNLSLNQIIKSKSLSFEAAPVSEVGYSYPDNTILRGTLSWSMVILPALIRYL